MSKDNKKTTDDYIDELKDMVVQANDGKPFSPWLMPQLRATAMNMVVLDKLQTAIEKADTLTDILPGSMGQQKISVNPLLDKYYKAQDVLLNQFSALGLNAKRSRKSDDDNPTDDPMANFYANAKK